MGTNRFSALYRFRELFGGDGKKRYIGTLLYWIFEKIRVYQYPFGGNFKGIF